MKFKRYLLCVCLLIMLFFTMGADFGEGSEYAFFAETKEKAEEIAALYSAELISFSDGIGVLEFKQNMQSFNAGFNENVSELPILYPEYLYTVELGDVNDDEENQWHLQTIRVESVWNTTKGKGIKVAVIDTGVDTDHSDLKDSIILADTSIPESEYGDDARFLSEYMGAEDYFGHGTHVVGIIGARDNGFGCKGIAPECEMISIKSLEKQGSRGIGKTSWVVAGIQKAMENNADVINLSLGGTSVKDEMLLAVIQEATQKGIIVVCAAGNITGTPKIFYPGAYEETIAVSGLKKSGETVEFASSYSNYGDWIDISAPGSTIMSTIIGGYGTKTGTSMASPIVAGAVALLMANDNSLTKEDILHLLYTSSTDMGDEGRDDKYGYGTLDIENMFKLYTEEYVVPKPIAKIPDKSVVGTGTAIMIDTPENADKVVYTLDGTEPVAESEVFPTEGIIFDEEVTQISINARCIMPNGRMGKAVTFTYTFVKGVVEADSKQSLENEIIPQYGAYIDPVLKLPCRRYKFTIGAKEKLTASVLSEAFSTGLSLFNSADENAQVLAEAEYQENTGSLTWKNKTKEPIDVWISVTEKEPVSDDIVLSYSLSWKCTKEKKQQSTDKNDDNNESNNDEQNNGQNNDSSESGSQNHTQTQTSSQEAEAKPSESAESTITETQMPAEEFIYEEDWLYTMTEVYEEQELITGVEVTEAISTDVKTEAEANNMSSDVKTEPEEKTEENIEQNIEETEIMSETAQTESFIESDNATENDKSYLAEIVQEDYDDKTDGNNMITNILIWMIIAVLLTILVIYVMNKKLSEKDKENDNMKG